MRERERRERERERRSILKINENNGKCKTAKGVCHALVLLYFAIAR
jgi:hypothetical protein